jgi:hypothetical protein
MSNSPWFIRTIIYAIIIPNFIPEKYPPMRGHIKQRGFARKI